MRLLAFCAISLLLAASLLRAQAPIFDSTFAPDPNVDVRSVRVQPDGRILVGGAFTRIGGLNRSYLVRLQVDGSVDSSFQPQLNSTVQAIALQADGRILVGGVFTTVNGVSRLRLARLNADGSLDSSFNANLAGNRVLDLLVLPDGRLLVAGDYTSVGGQPRTGLVRLRADGAVDSTFVGDAGDRNSPTGAPGVYTIARQLDGRIVLGGQFGTVNGRLRRGLARLSADGVLDETFDPVGPTAAASIQKVLALRDGNFLVGGSFSTLASESIQHLARFFADGRIDPTFSPRPSSVVFAALEEPDGHLLVGGLFTTIGGLPRSYLARVRPSGQLDSSFTVEVGGTTVATAPGVQELTSSADGRIVLGGSFTTVAGVPRAQLARLVPSFPQVVAPSRLIYAVAGEPVVLAPVILGLPGTYQWLKDGVPIPGATSPTLTLAGFRASDVGNYELTAANGFGAASSGPITVVIAVRPQIVTQPAAVSVGQGATATFSVVVIGSPAPTYQWLRNGSPVAGATGASLAVVASAATAGTYTVVVSNVTGSVTSAPASLTVNPPPQLANLSVRAAMANAQSLIVGFTVGGSPVPVLVRAAGPALQPLGVATPMADPRIELFRDSTKLLENDSWPAVLTDAFAGVGAFGFAAGSRDAALREVVSGSHSAVASGTGAGVVLVEVYHAGGTAGGRFVNFSARHQVGTGEDILIAGFACNGQGTIRVLVRAVGPTLGGAPFGLSGVLADPVLELFDAAGALVAANNDYEPATAAAFGGVGAFALAPGARDAALIATLQGGRNYTAQVRGANGTTGTALIEVYELP